MESAAVPTRIDYGEHPSQFAQLWIPHQRIHNTIVIIIHGGFWRQKYGVELGVPLAQDLNERGYVVWNLEYRRTAGGNGGWPQTFLDIAAGIDALDAALHAAGLETGPRVAIGHSAGGHLALWAAGRHKLPPQAPGALQPGAKCLDAVIAQAGVLDLDLADTLGLSDNAARLLLGCTREEDPERWQWANPAQRMPLGIPLVVLHGTLDEDVPVHMGRSFSQRHAPKEEAFEYVEFVGDHYGLISVEDPAWDLCVLALAKLEAALRIGE